MSEFIVKDRKGKRRVPITKQMMVGRSPGSDLVLHTNFASRHHAWVWRQKDSVLIEDLASTNGTYLNGQRVTGPRFLNHNDMVAIGDSQLLFVDSWDPSSQYTPARGMPLWMPGQIFCRYCGASNHPLATQCVRCGSALEPEAGYAMAGRGEGGRSPIPFTPPEPVVARPFPMAWSSPRSGAGAGMWLVILLLSILVVGLLIVVGVLAIYALG